MLHLQLLVLPGPLLLCPPGFPLLTAALNVLQVLLLLPQEFHLGEGRVGERDVVWVLDTETAVKER